MDRRFGSLLCVFLFGCASAESCETLCARLGVPYRAVVAHRGASYHAPEETIPAYRIACELGVDFLELDLQRTKDGRLIALHDKDLRRTTDVEKVFPERAEAPVSAFTLAELRRLDAGSWFNEKFPSRARAAFVGAKIATLEEIVAVALASPKTPGLYIETKAPGLFPGIEKDLARELGRLGWTGRRALLLQTFDGKSLAQLRAHFPNRQLVWLMWIDPKKIESTTTKHIAEYLAVGRTHGAGAVGINYAALANAAIVTAIRAARVCLHPYTVNDLHDFAKLEEQGAHGFFTDRPDLLLEHYGRTAPPADQVMRKLGYE